MAVAALVALVHDLIITVGIYALTGFDGDAGHGHRRPDHPGLTRSYDTVVVFDKVKENTRGSAAQQPDDLQRGGQPGAQPDPGAVDQHLDHRPAAGGGDPRRRCRLPGRRHAEGPRARAVRRHGRRHVLLDLHRHPAARASSRSSEPADEGAGQRVEAAQVAAAEGLRQVARAGSRAGAATATAVVYEPGRRPRRRRATRVPDGSTGTARRARRRARAPAAGSKRRGQPSRSGRSAGDRCRPSARGPAADAHP